MVRTIKLAAIAFIVTGIISCKKDDVPNTAPAVALTSPADNSSFGTPGSITITATASDANGSVSKVDFYNGSTLIGTSSTSPYSFTWTGVTEGHYAITAKATDNSGASTTSAAVNVKVNPTFKATLNAANERPTPNTSTGTGTSILILDIDTKIFTVSTTYTGLTGAATASHIHKGDPTVAGGVIFPFSNVTVSPIVYTSTAIDAAQEADLRAGLWYTNVHTALNPGGEIRGQLIKQ